MVVQQESFMTMNDISVVENVPVQLPAVIR